MVGGLDFDMLMMVLPAGFVSWVWGLGVVTRILLECHGRWFGFRSIYDSVASWVC